MNITVIGAGHVGLIAGLCFAETGHNVCCVDNDPEKIRTLKEGRTPFFEPLLEELLERARGRGRFQVTPYLEEGVAFSQVIFLCLGTPPLPGGDADLSFVERVTRQIAGLSEGYTLIVEKSTVPVLTGERIQRTMEIYRRGSGAEFDVASNPEFLSEGTAVMDFLYPDRIVAGVESRRAEDLLRQIYEPVTSQSFEWELSAAAPEPRAPRPMLVTNRNSAELIKHASNSFLAMKISYINAVANLCDQVGADVKKVAEGMGYDHRIGDQFLRAGIGFGGFCFPKDLQAFIRIAETSGCDFSLLKEVERINLGQIEVFFEKLKREVWVLKGKTIAVWGLSFKPHTDDLRYSPALAVVERLLAEGAAVRAYDPRAMAEAKRLYPAAQYCSSAIEAAGGADAVLLLTEWPEFSEVDFAALREAMARPLILDGRNLFDPEAMRGMGFEYVGLGRG